MEQTLTESWGRRFSCPRLELHKKTAQQCNPLKLKHFIGKLPKISDEFPAIL
ncbi:hypothetical protein [Gluconacetobacter diazotrophicus]|uniref:Uncharacterized protein n=2 Tax=Gluconacetobacter diazotrophicus TaxID=33996 RepID=A9HIE8_GLUDA|nr:hypothetical protein [Gluconacetobacter diazotrophicus]MBB2155826.1 hypothetical protein [Gluconacetobacter diazotrophicus]CAP55760.1 hypothetical protein GDI1817 [Gluconacetobacter diazotrophicus PA1 5]